MSESEKAHPSEPDSENDTPTMPPPPLPEGPIVELVVANLANDPRAE